MKADPPPRHPFGRRLLRWIAEGFGAGRAPVAPGTVGTVVAIPIYLALNLTDALLYWPVVVVMFAFGVWCCGIAERDLKEPDAGRIVWDEIVGYLIAMGAAPAGWAWFVAGFLLFRLFDIAKPFPIRWFERRTPGGFGIMLDDALAGGYVVAILGVAELLLS